MSLYNELKRRNVLRVAIAYLAGAWLLIEITETLFPIYGFSDAAIRLIVTLLAIGFPILLIISWVFELTPEGLKLEKDIDPSVSVTHHTSKKLDRVIIVLLALALGYFAFDKFVLSPQRQAEELATATQEAREEGHNEALLESYGDKSIAILPFVNMSSDPEQEYFSDGVSEELLNLLSRIPDLRVISRSSAFSFKGKDIDIPTIAKQLNVAYILEGSVRKAGNQVRITAQLVEARSDTHLWSETFDRELENIFVVQDEISTAIVGVLKEQLGLQIETVPRVITVANTEAHEAIMRGRYLVVQRTQVTIENAVREFEKAIALDPDSALAHAELAIATLLLSPYGELTVTEAVTRAARHTEQAMALDSTLAEALAATGYLLRYQNNLQESLTYYRQAIQINPNYSIVYLWMRQSLLELGRYAEAFEMLEASMRLNPLSIPTSSSYVLALYRRNRMDEVNQELEKLASIYPDRYARMRGYYMPPGGNGANWLLGNLDFLRSNPGDDITRGDYLARPFAMLGLEKEALAVSEDPSPFTLRILGKPVEAVTTAEALRARDPDSLYARRELGQSLSSAGEYARAQPILEEMWQRSDRRMSSIFGRFRAADAAALIAIRRNADVSADVSGLIAAIKDNVRRYREAGITGADEWLSADYEAGLASYLAGEREKGLALIAKGVESGYFIPPKEAYLQVLYDDPGFASILAGQEAWQARERNRFLTIVCINNPYATVWQPAEGTCEQFAARDEN